MSEAIKAHPLAAEVQRLMGVIESNPQALRITLLTAFAILCRRDAPASAAAVAMALKLLFPNEPTPPAFDAIVTELQAEQPAAPEPQPDRSEKWNVIDLSLWR